MNKITRILINTALAVIDRLVIGKIQYPPVQTLLHSTFGNLKEVSVIVTDNDPDNAAQLKAYFNANKIKLAGTSIVTLRAVVDEEIKDNITKEIMLGLLKEIEEAIES